MSQQDFTYVAQHDGRAGTAEPQPIKSIGSAHKISGFFESIPAGCDLYMLSHIIHDWSEARCLSILANCHRAMSPGSRLLIIEAVLPEGKPSTPARCSTSPCSR